MNINDVENVRQFLLKNSTQLLKNYPGLLGITFNTKQTNGLDTGEPALCFSVTEKKPLAALSSCEIIPSYMQINSDFYKTDVTVGFKASRMQCINPLNPFVHPLSANYAKTRPLKGGVSCITVGSSDATLGMLCVDKLDGTIVGLTNNHVGNITPLVLPDDTSFGNNGFHKIMTQPATNLYNPFGESYLSDDMIKNYVGKTKRSVAESLTGTNTVDGSIFSLSSYSLIDSSSVNIVGFDVPGPYKWATTEELNSLNVPGHVNYGSPCFRSGRTLGAFGYPGNNYTCKLSVYSSVYATSIIAYDEFDESSTQLNYSLPPGPIFVTVGGYDTTNFADLIYFNSNSTTVDAITGGDSGSILFALLSSTMPAASAWKVIGLNFAGGRRPDGMGVGLACRIDNVVDQLNIASWTGAMPVNYTPKDKFIAASNNKINVKTLSLSLCGQKFLNHGSAIFDPNYRQPGMWTKTGYVSASYDINVYN